MARPWDTLGKVASARATRGSAISNGRSARSWVHVERDVYLAAGTHRWRMFSSHWAHADTTHWVSRRIDVRRGTYSWWDRWSASTDVNRGYAHDSQLREWARPTGGRAVVTGDYQWDEYGDGIHHW